MYFDRRLWALTAGVRSRIAAAVAIGLLAAVAGIARLALLGWLLARVLAGDSLAALAPALVLTAVALVGRSALDYARTMAAHHTAARVQAELRRSLYAHVAALGPAHFVRDRTGDVMLSMVEGIQQLEVYFGQYLPQLFVAALTPVLIFAFVAFLDLPVALVVLVAALVALLAPGLWHRWDSRASLARSQAYKAFGAEFLDAVQGLATLKAFGQSTSRARRLEEKATSLFHSTMWVLGTNTLARGITDTVIAMGAAAALAVGAWRVSHGAMSLSALLVILMLGIEVFRPLRELRVLLHQGMLGLSASRGIFAILDARAAVTDRPGGLEPRDAGVTFEDVTFVYPGGRRAAHAGVSFSVRPGERVGIVGPSGSGKSTVARLLLRFYDPERGRVLIGGRDLRELSLAQIRARIAVVSQDTWLFHGTVEENLRMGRPGATADELRAAARAANAEEFILRLPQGYATIVGERGVRLSGGQRQRIAIARALLRDAPILVLDEALSSVDAESEALIQAALDRLMVGRTTLVFAHRLSSVIGADRILVLDEGRVVEQGTHAALIAGHGVYARLMAGQARDGAGAVAVGARATAVVDAEARETAEAEPADAIVHGAAVGWGAVLKTLLDKTRGYRGRLLLTFGLGVARVSALIGVGVLSALAVRAVKHGEPAGTLLITLGVVAPLAGLLHWVESWLAHDVAYRLLTDMRLDVFRKLDALAPAYLTRRRTGDLVGVATHDVELIEYFFAHTVTPALVAVLVPLAVLATLAAVGWPLALVLVPFLLYTALIPVLGRARIDRLGSRAREASGDLNAHVVDTVQGLAEIVAYGRVATWGEALHVKAQRFFDLRLPFLRDLARQTALQEVATGFGGLAVITVGAWLARDGRLDSGVLPLLTLLALSAFVPLWEVAQVGRQLADTLGAARRLRAVESEPVPVRDGRGVSDALGVNGGGVTIELTDVRFTYPGRTRPALDGVSLRIEGGSTVAVVGPSGAGKTTIASLLLRFWDPEAGVVRLFGHDLRDYQLDALRRRIALVAQDTYLFHDTLRANIVLARPEASDKDVRAAVEHAALAELVDALPDGLDTVVGERGARLSGGQRQRVAIARAFLKDAPVLVLDEATSHLDAVSEAAVRLALERLSRDRTTLVIAHRLSTVRDADAIVVLDEGKVMEVGPHAALLARGGLYAHLVARQLAAGAALTAS
ncbi:MAG: thiol reductant ABC exporter subunit CydC [Candidatus Rokuibacteriota bacterium]|nr:MAG: thiol reductant ABC exporter subunit CydC [Candidatus Rokubacteria bacterium]